MKMKKYFLLLIALIIIVSAGTYSGMFRQALNLGKAYIYCYGEIPEQDIRQAGLHVSSQVQKN